MPKLLSEEEFAKISAAMTEAYGLPPPRIIGEQSAYGNSWSIRVEIVRPIMVSRWDWTEWFKKEHLFKVKDFYADNFEDGLVKLQQELAKFDGRAVIAEKFREKYTMAEADVVMDKILSE